MSPNGGPSASRLAFLAAVCILFAAAAWTAGGFPPRARIFPQVVAVTCLFLGFLAAARGFAGKGNLREERPGFFLDHLRSALPYLGWLAGYYAAICLLGLVLASGLFVAAFLAGEGEVAWYRSVVGGAIISGFLLGLGVLVGLDWPPGLLTGW